MTARRLLSTNPAARPSAPFTRFWPWALGIFVAVAGVYALVAWDRVVAPSPHFHFVDLAQSFLDGKLHTDTPHRRRGAAPREDDALGLQEAVDRALTDENGKPVGWNDWASYRIIQLKGGDELRGVWVWKDKRNEERRHEFHTLDGSIAIVDASKDVARTCGESGRQRCDETIHFVSFPPGPAVVMLPAVALWGYHTNDVVLTLLFAALNAVLFFALLGLLQQRGYMRRSRSEHLVLTALFAFGTVAFFCSVRGEVWFTALVLGLTFHLAYVLAALDARRPLLAGIFLAAGFATRTPLVFAASFFAIQLIFPASGERRTWVDVAKRVGWFAIPTVAAGVALLLYNAARFESPFEFGHTYLVEGTRDAIRDHGLFSMWFLNRNLQAAFVNMPVITAAYPFVHITRHGLSLLATTPPLLFLFRPRLSRAATDAPDGVDEAAVARLRWAFGLATLCILVPAVFYQNTGWAQFGYRFSLDFTPYLLGLVAIDRRHFGRLALVLVGLAILINLFGAITFGRAGEFYYD